MNIVFIGLTSAFTESMAYQDNMLSNAVLADGNQLTFISDAKKFVNGNLQETGAEDTVLSNGMRLIRLRPAKICQVGIARKLGYYPGVYDLLTKIEPEVIMVHNLQYLSILDVVRYKKKHPEVKLYADTHTSAANSASSWLSYHVLHRMFYRRLTRKILPYLEKYWYIGFSEKEFSIRCYGVPELKMEFFPLGGWIFSDAEYEKKRMIKRAELGLEPDELLLLHTGKLDSLKKTEDLLRAFAAVPQMRAKLAIIGSIPTEMEPILHPLIEQDSRVVYLGWKKAEELLEYLCACDLYCQPGSVSATMQNAVCCGCPTMAYPVDTYVQVLDYGQFFWVETQADMEKVFASVQQTPQILQEKTQKAWKCARELLDYRALAARLYQ